VPRAQRSYLVLDIETVPDSDRWSRPDTPVGTERPFPPTYAHRVIVIGCLWMDAAYRMKRLGIIGMGRIGSAVAQRARAFGMEVIGTRRGQAIDELLASSDIVSIHTPLTRETRHLINRETLGAMKRGAYLINTARGPIVDEAALCDALESGQLRGAGLDVYEDEPRVSPRLAAMPNVVLLPHIGSATEEARTAMARIAATEVARFLRSEPQLHAVT